MTDVLAGLFELALAFGVLLAAIGAFVWAAGVASKTLFRDPSDDRLGRSIIYGIVLFGTVAFIFWIVSKTGVGS